MGNDSNVDKKDSKSKMPKKRIKEIERESKFNLFYKEFWIDFDEKLPFLCNVCNMWSEKDIKRWSAKAEKMTFLLINNNDNKKLWKNLSD